MDLYNLSGKRAPMSVLLKYLGYDTIEDFMKAADEQKFDVKAKLGEAIKRFESGNN